MNKQRVALVIAIAGLAGCTNKQLYQGMMQNRQHACLQELPQDQEACFKRYEMSFEEYQQTRQQAQQQVETAKPEKQ
ncbi:hypothetical protein FJ444_15070 [Aestuariibacter sp. GS-14]|uniref:hypothetical protein n=1 Tax=Aestuariibacter sp. GS-14 TaxID=2590670 RepID=UPI0011281A3C|nr:hypothetical protein [Aestuariibacter sp. GS-14]TPV56509.1 hypothetical protein FJ444_15070 [Aestuariibacter sp. GS-14]